MPKSKAGKLKAISPVLASATTTPVASIVPPAPDAKCLRNAELENSALVLAPSQVLHHIYSNDFEPLSFNPGLGGGRFHPFRDEAGKRVPIFYAANTEEGAYCETLLRAVDANGYSPRTVPGKRVWASGYAQLQVRDELRLASLSGNQLIRLGISRAALLEPGPLHYPATAAWAQAIHREYPNLHGIAWISRQHDASNCYMLFGDRVRDSQLQLICAQNLGEPNGRLMADAVCQRLNIVISR